MNRREAKMHALEVIADCIRSDVASGADFCTETEEDRERVCAVIDEIADQLEARAKRMRQHKPRNLSMLSAGRKAARKASRAARNLAKCIEETS